jgi:Trk K+ transport system NAD-binding subunit
VAALLEDRIEVIEAEAADGSLLALQPLAELGLPRGILVAALRRGGRIVVPRGTDRIAPGDRVLLIATSEQAGHVAALLGSERR